MCRINPQTQFPAPCVRPIGRQRDYLPTDNGGESAFTAEQDLDYLDHLARRMLEKLHEPFGVYERMKIAKDYLQLASEHGFNEGLFSSSLGGATNSTGESESPDPSLSLG